MTHVGTLWGQLRQPATKIICSVAALNDLGLQLPEWNFSAKPAEFLSDFSYGKIPAFKGEDGFILTEGMVIARYVCSLGTKKNLLGSNAREKALVEQWCHFAEQEIGVPGQNIMGLVYGFAGPFNSEALNKQTERLARAMAHVESHLASCPSGYLVSDSVTLADFALASMVYGASFVALGAAERAKYPAVFAHYAKVTGDDKVKAFWGTEAFTEEAATGPRTLPSGF